jgi:hypothetical protein
VSDTSDTSDTMESHRAVADSIGVPVARRHIFLCCDQTKPKCCDKDRGLQAWEFLKRRLKELGLAEQGGILRTKVDLLPSCIRRVPGTPNAIRRCWKGLSRNTLWPAESSASI